MSSTIGLVMRKSFNQHDDHIETLTKLADKVILFTVNVPKCKDLRFDNVIEVSSSNEDENISKFSEAIDKHGINYFITWQETDIILTAKANALINQDYHAVKTSMLSRNKASQRNFLKKHEIPSPQYYEIQNENDIYQISKDISFPVIIKPTMAASSVSVLLANDTYDLVNSFREINEIVQSNKGLYYDSNYAEIALIEEFLPGEEVTVDGAIINGKFVMGGIHNKSRMMGPYFEEDEYTLPYLGEDFSEITNICENIVRNLSLKDSLFNVELRKDRKGIFKVVEFSIRISGGHVYRNIRDVHGIDLVALHTLSILEAEKETIDSYKKRKETPDKCTCIKFIYRQGVIEENNANSIANNPLFKRYYPLAKKGDQVFKAPDGFDVTGLLSLITDYKSEQDLITLKEKARELDKELNVRIKSTEETTLV
ncbi:ATP-grasp domain-containing protein [Niallia taxi]|uniref:ATP-grasp domain-containing protein n=1 Tax=Niallia taxi TaxID=2499688 RepID=UPI00317A4390